MYTVLAWEDVHDSLCHTTITLTLEWIAFGAEQRRENILMYDSCWVSIYLYIFTYICNRYPMTAHIPWTWRFFEVISTSKNQLPKTLGRSRSFGAMYEVLSWVSVQECWVNGLKWGRVQFHSCLLMITQDWATLFVKQSENLFLSLDWNHSLVMDFKNGLRDEQLARNIPWIKLASFHLS